MNTYIDSSNLINQKKFDTLKIFVNKERTALLKKRLKKKAFMTDMEYLLGAFIEMYEPHLKDIIHKFTEKGYAIDASSGFGDKNSEFQVMTGDFSIDYVTKNKLEKIGVKFREYNGSESLIFWPEKATLEDIKAKWMQIVDALSDKGILTVPSTSADAVMFRRRYIPKDPYLRKQRLFERLKYNTQRKIEIDIKRRKVKNPHPSTMESILGLFTEELEPQVRQAVIKLNKKGYSTDASGFMDNSCSQMIEGDFQLDGKTISTLEAIGVIVETNPSGYTRIQFLPLEADISKIKRKWNKIVSLLPDKNQVASTSMTRKAREFRIKY